MGFLSNLKAQIEAAQAAGLAMSGAQPVSMVPEFINPRPQDEVDSLLAGTGTIRAIVIGYRHQVLEAGERVGSMTVHVRVRPRGPAGTVGDEVVVKAKLSSLEATLLDPGLDIPVERDAATGAITKVASAELKQELAPRMDVAKKRNPAIGMAPELEGMIELAKMATTRAPAATPAAPAESQSDPRRQPVDRITWETYVAICAHLQVQGAPNGDDAVAQKYGVIRGTWAAISNVWRMRIAADADLAELFDHDLAAAVEGQ
jgi:hypothetical protein